jgi:hypothetical protein
MLLSALNVTYTRFFGNVRVFENEQDLSSRQNNLFSRTSAMVHSFDLQPGLHLLCTDGQYS